MPLHLEKSVRAGPFRFDVLKRGAGLSVASKVIGLVGFPRAHFIRAGIKGIRYQGSVKNNDRPEAPTTEPKPRPRSLWINNVEMVEVESSDVLQMRNESFGAVLDDVNAGVHGGRMAQLLPAMVIAVALVAGLIVHFDFLALIILGFPLCLVGRWIDSYRRVTVLFYELNAQTVRSYTTFTEAFDLMVECFGKWHIEAGGAITDLATWKHYAGASHLIQKNPTIVTYSLPDAIRSNITPPALQVGRQIIYFFPDVALIQDGQKFGAVGYADLRLSWQPSNFVEQEQPLADALIVGYVWEHPNKDGGPDRRYGANRQLPICCYDALHISSPDGLNELVEFSRTGIVQAFVATIALLPKQSFQEELSALR